MSLRKYYSQQTKFKKWGDALLLFCPALTGIVLQLPISDNAMKWIIAALNFGTVAGKFLLNKYDAKEKDENKTDTASDN